jgi:4-oxalocrotonate tautomerase
MSRASYGFDMPMVNISLRAGSTPAYRRSIADSVHAAMMEVLLLPADDRFQIVHEHPVDHMIHDPRFLGVARSDRSVFVHLFINQRPVDQKRRLFSSIVDKLTVAPGVRIEDIFIGIVEVAPENWWAFARPEPPTAPDDAPADKHPGTDRQ